MLKGIDVMHLPAILQFEAATILPRIRAAKFIFWGNPEIYMAELAGRPCFPRSTPPSVHPGKATHRYTSSGGNGWERGGPPDPQPSPVPIQSRLVNGQRGIRAPESGGRGQSRAQSP